MCYGPGMKYMRRTIETVEYFDDELEIPEGFPEVMEVPSYPALPAPKPSLLGRIAKWTCIGGVAWLTFLVIMGGAHARTLIDHGQTYQLNARDVKDHQWPTPYLGEWCTSDDSDIESRYYRADNVRYANGCPDDMPIKMIVGNKMLSSGQSDCIYLSVKSRFDSHAGNSTHTQGNIVVRIEANCMGEESPKPVTFDVILYKEDRLIVTTIKQKSEATEWCFDQRIRDSNTGAHIGNSFTRLGPEEKIPGESHPELYKCNTWKLKLTSHKIYIAKNESWQLWCEYSGTKGVCEGKKRTVIVHQADEATLNVLVK
jgi:hypothetical protein